MNTIKKPLGDIDGARPRIVAVFGEGDGMLACRKDFASIGAL